MPEGDTIHGLARALQPDLVGRRARAVRVAREPVPELACAPFDDVLAIGKHLFLSVGTRALRTHMGMHGSWHRYRHGEPWRQPRWRALAEIELDDRVLVCFQPAEIELVDLLGARHQLFLRRLGPDLLAPDFDARAIVRRARRVSPPGTLLADVLLDQRLAAGIGNVYKSELLFLAGLHPLRTLGSCDDAQLAALYELARSSLVGNVAGGPRRTRGARPTDGPSEGRTWVYGRAGEPCSVCGEVLVSRRLGRHRRRTEWCPGCQPDQPRGRAAPSGSPVAQR